LKFYDPVADFNELTQLYESSALEIFTKDKKYDVLIIAVSHKEFLEIDPESFINENSVVFDVKGMFLEKPYLRL
jgi:UDP-N-acetyl-D-galactosamine dehydrogenase